MSQLQSVLGQTLFNIKDSSSTAQITALFFHAVMAVCLVIAKRLLIGIQGYNYAGFTATLAAIHYLCFATAIQIHQKIKGNMQHLRLGYCQEFLLVVFVCVAQILQNLSLMVNPMGLYAVTQSLAVPIGLLVVIYHQDMYGVLREVGMLCGLAMCIGALVFTANCGGVSGVGLAVAICSALATCLQCLFQGRLTGELGLNSLNLDAEIACPACLLMLLISPQIDFAIHGQEMLEYTFPHAATLLIVASCMLAVMWGISCYPCEEVVTYLEGNSKVRRQVVIASQIIKVVVIAFAANVMFFEEYPLRKIVGLGMFLAGLFAFSNIVLRDLQAMLGAQLQTQLQTHKVVDEEKGDVALTNSFRGVMCVKYLYSRI
eukprot:TRINITY_DN16513_c0_g2_i1.p2 TRINITY_DN16513_c0_g2~~TRINITY_DN16513_c0_g2_i1.p2  ORF type:complete len:373 (+),score=38.82 TRINITY_DN16513_c0_g2_i1:447-1565(+)